MKREEDSLCFSSRLRDKDARVKKNALMVLMHLILNDMIKVKGQVYEMAVCMESDDQRISDLARLFFSELSRKGNHLYNILPDVISHLSVAPNLSSESFKYGGFALSSVYSSQEPTGRS